MRCVRDAELPDKASVNPHASIPNPINFVAFDRTNFSFDDLSLLISRPRHLIRWHLQQGGGVLRPFHFFYQIGRC